MKTKIADTGYPGELTDGGAILLLTDAMKSIADCNHNKRAIREIGAHRTSGADY
ncbi:hypothetical protein VP018_004316 [Morganella morganii]|nr:hypothetical protein [Morganella morganii]EMD0832377.1 hypothetical protein [Morganella morganii]EMD0832390.1 hypothetical protein [Morganella morganii]